MDNPFAIVDNSTNKQMYASLDLEDIIIAKFPTLDAAIERLTQLQNREYPMWRADSIFYGAVIDIRTGEVFCDSRLICK